MLPTDLLHTTAAGEAVPIWMAALVASECEARGAGFSRKVHWRWEAGRATYTNGGMETEILIPLGIRVRRGETVLVSWLRGDSGYTIELQADSLAA